MAVRRDTAHRKIYEELRRRIVSNEYEGDEIPPERLLIEEFGVSRNTIRAALQLLVNEQLIARSPGRGTRIIRKGRAGYWALGSLNELAGEFSMQNQLTLTAGKEPASQHPEARDLFGLTDEDELFHIFRLLTKDSVPFAVSHIYADARNSENVPPEKFGTAYFVDLIQEYSGKVAARAKQVVSAEKADLSTALKLGIEKDDPLLIVQRTYFTSSDEPLVHIDIICRPDRYKQVINLIRNQIAQDTPKET